MIKVSGRIIKVEHYPDGTQKINLGFDPTEESCHEITWLYEKEEELATLIYIVSRNHVYRFVGHNVYDEQTA